MSSPVTLTDLQCHKLIFRSLLENPDDLTNYDSDTGDEVIYNGQTSLRGQLLFLLSSSTEGHSYDAERDLLAIAKFLVMLPQAMGAVDYYVFTMSRCQLSRCAVPTWTRPQSGQVHYTHAAAEALYDRTRSFAL